MPEMEGMEQEAVHLDHLLEEAVLQEAMVEAMVVAWVEEIVNEDRVLPVCAEEAEAHPHKERHHHQQQHHHHL